jgi:excisionase family DNA binding protein
MEGSVSRARERSSQPDASGVPTELLAADLSPREAARQTGLSRTLIYREIERGHLRAYKVGGRLRITLGALAEWKLLHAVAPRSPGPAYEPACAARRSGDGESFASDLKAIRTQRAA